MLHSQDIPAADAIFTDVPAPVLAFAAWARKTGYKDIQIVSLDLPALQLSILQTAATYFKPYGDWCIPPAPSTKKENEKVVSAFLDRHSAFFLAAECTRFPCEQGQRRLLLRRFGETGMKEDIKKFNLFGTLPRFVTLAAALFVPIRCTLGYTRWVCRLEEMTNLSKDLREQTGRKVYHSRLPNQRKNMFLPWTIR